MIFLFNKIFFIYCIFFLILNNIVNGDDAQKYRLLREKCAKNPSNQDCIKLKSSFLSLIQKCQKINTQKQFSTCLQVKNKLCAVFPSTCAQINTSTTKPKTSTKSKLTTTTTTRETINDEEFVKVPIDPDELRSRGEYCIRHGKEKKCKDLLNNLKTKYSSCGKKKVETTSIKSEQFDCHSFEKHMCQAFPKFAPCIKKTPK